MSKIVVIKRFDDKEHAVNALRLVKIPLDQRANVPYLASSTGEMKTTLEDIKLLLWTLKRAHPDGITEIDILAKAKEEGLDTKKVKTYLEKCKSEGKILEKSGEKLKIM